MSLNNKILNSFRSPKYNEGDITVILSIRLLKDNYWLLDRLKFLFGWYNPNPSFLIVDFGSERNFSEELKDVCLENDAHYHYVDDQGVFSLSLARNIGYEISNTDLLFFTDPDFLMGRDAFTELLKLSSKVGLGVNKLQKLSMPAYHVNENESKAFELKSHLSSKQALLNEWGYKGLSSQIGEVFDFVAPYSNNFLCHRDYFDLAGGYSTEFRGHGSEDFEFMVRSNLLFGDFPIPENVSDDLYKPNTDDFFEQKSYSGFRRLFELETLPEELHGLKAFHIWHPLYESKGWYENNDWKRLTFNKIVGRYLDCIPHILKEDYLNRKESALCISENHSHSGYFIPLRAAGFKLSVLCSLEADLINEEIKKIERGLYNKVFITKLNQVENNHFQALVRVAELSGVDVIEIEPGLLAGTVSYISNAEKTNEILTIDEIKSFKNTQKIVNDCYENSIKGTLLSSDFDDYESTYERLSWLRITPDKKNVYIPLQNIDELNKNDIDDYQVFISDLDNIIESHNDFLFLINRNELSSGDFQGLTKRNNTVFFDKTSNTNALMSHIDVMITFSSNEGFLSILHQKPFYVLGSINYSINNHFGEEASSISGALSSFFEKKYQGSLLKTDAKAFLSWLMFNRSSYVDIKKDLFRFATEDLNSYEQVRVPLLNFGGRQYSFQVLEGDKYQFSEKSYLSSKMGVLQGKIKRNEDKLITLIVPLRLSEFVFEGEERLKRIIENVPIGLFDILIVDYGTVAPYKEILSKFSHFSNVTIHTVVLPEGTPFSIGAARDMGVQYAKTPVVLFHDVDFICTSEMYQKINTEVVVRQMSADRAKDFFCVPVAFLNQYGSHSVLEDFDSLSPAVFDSYLHQRLLTTSRKFCEFIVYGSSAIVVNRYHYLSLGGHNRDFYGHGAEDYDVLHRLALNAPKGPRPKDYYIDTKSNLISEYRGFRAFFALYGIDVFTKGISMVHLWHPQRALPDYFQSKRNFALLKKIMVANDKEGAQPHPLEDRNLKTKTLVLSAPDSIFVRSIRDVIPAMGEVTFADEKKFAEPSEWINYITAGQFTKVGFKNPYGNSYRLALYEEIKDKGISFWVMDRGALPNSWFFDTNGFNADSASYARFAWNRELLPEQDNEVVSYIKKITQDDNTLEKNGQRKGKELLRSELKAGYKKVLFIPFQRPGDSVCRYFAGKVESAQGFNEFIAQVVERIDKNEWLVIGKKHPLEGDTPEIEGVQFVPDDTHIHDLLELCDKVCLLNSGVGLLAALFDKPVIYAGEAFYGHNGINYAAESVDKAVELVNSDLSVDSDLVKQFVFHLVTEVYSFAETRYKEVAGKDGATLMMAEEIKFEQIRGLVEQPIILGKKNEGVGLDEPLFYSFGGRQNIVKNNNKKTGHINANVKHKLYQKLGLKLFYVISYPFATSRQSKKLKQDPHRFFRDSKNSLTIKYGKLFNIS